MQAGWHVACKGFSSRYVSRLTQNGARLNVRACHALRTRGTLAQAPVMHVPCSLPETMVCTYAAHAGQIILGDVPRPAAPAMWPVRIALHVRWRAADEAALRRALCAPRLGVALSALHVRLLYQTFTELVGRIGAPLHGAYTQVRCSPSRAHPTSACTQWRRCYNTWHEA